ncbi:hypothetical protein [Domibacillus iocasae]|uniref:Uncharacterized protein n=1 Tax=Domibacillus iocasae TaxID=1714016 RepID=A0A1E7DNZ9_9BACI|nr:hypothetical protein [Domibacillus iocasae]OES44820.1 hypothetical protein BA724_05985 [Domibacillus iocasae]
MIAAVLTSCPSATIVLFNKKDRLEQNSRIEKRPVLRMMDAFSNMHPALQALIGGLISWGSAGGGD